MTREPPVTLEKAWEKINAVRDQCKKFLFGIDQAIDNMIIGWLSLVPYDGEGRKELGQGHVLLMEAPGFGKTGLMRIMAYAMNASCSFVTGHPEIQTSEFIGKEIYLEDLGRYLFARGRIFTNFFLFDEINRTHPKSQAALFQAMEERLAVVGVINQEKGVIEERSFSLFPISDDPSEKRRFFWVVASGNPIEQEGTYSIPEAQMDRFSFSFGIDPPPRGEEMRIRLENVFSDQETSAKRVEKVLDLATVLDIAHFVVKQVRFTPAANEYLMRLIENSRPARPLTGQIFSDAVYRTREFASPSFLRRIDDCVMLGLSPRANFHFEAGARTVAFLHGRDYVSLDDIKKAARLVMPHRLILKAKARAKKITNQLMIEEVLQNTELPT